MADEDGLEVRGEEPRAEDPGGEDPAGQAPVDESQVTEESRVTEDREQTEEDAQRVEPGGDLDEPASTPPSEPAESGGTTAEDTEFAHDSQPGEPALDAASISSPEAPLRAPARWWVVADEQVVARLRRVLSGPPRAAKGTGLHT
ncbi:MAG: hypothetical protein KC457_01990 [Myxococcales bacterium]|nr:hypothetical protein [Myxococcales bacterium]